VLVTGGAGIIGSALVDRLVHDGHQVHVVDNFSRGNRENLVAAESSGRCSVHELDINAPELAGIVAAVHPAVLFHLAAQIDVRASVDDPVADAAANVLGTLNVAEAALVGGVGKLVFVSSGGAIYGDNDDLPLSETAPVQPFSPYGAAKAAGEIYLNTYWRTRGLDCTHLALANAYGPRQDHRGEAGVVAVFAHALLDGEPTRLFGDGRNTRDYVYVDDVVDALVRAAARGRPGARYNIGTGRQTADADLHALVAKTVGVPDEPEHAPARLGDVRATALDAFKAYRELGWAPRTSLVEGVRRTVEHFAQPAEARWEAPELDAADPGSTTEPA
jgi:UDP-glucose 4-epimerase